ncbi:ABC transporter ATP-binding protein [Amycolatopsis sp. CA-230715]|uniref:ABC transporter ATP-binding protein n=1 Tax=Amycolatopsis sp. CA-230715 TaxID=2745196 RepID=UPI001C00E400|nr:ABC transporter ATP-binding protein [Amycolatopsis sp. CA-230715]QWF78418.1 Glutathione import ATP-binding protein GsiA [Amycolatopsis sp. CA-230715]
MADRVLEFTGLEIGFATAQGTTEAVKGISFGVCPGEVVAVVGESGSGKSATSLSALGLLPPTATVRGSVVLDGDELLELSEKDFRARRGDDVAMVFQEPMTALNPLRTIGWQVAEALLLHRDISTSDARARAGELLALVGIDEPERRLDQYPHELSGGLRQRVMIAMALSCEPKVLIADEPTTALDVTVQAEILDLLRRMRDELGTAIVLITHSMGVVADLADRVVVLYQGEIVEEGDVRQVFAEPAHDYTRRLLAAVPHLGRAPARVVEEARADEEPVLAVRDLVVDFSGRRGAGKYRAVDEVSFEIAPREVLGLVGESGSGKTTVGRCAVRLQKPTSGRIEVFGTDVAGLGARKLREVRKRIGMVFQDPASSLDPRMTVGECVAEPLVLGKIGNRDARVAELLDSVRLEKAHRDRYPHELSGGQRQRVSLARALAMDPALLVADEPTSALDVSVQAAVLDLLGQLQRELGFACLFISHDLAVIDQLSDRVVVMRKGKVVEQGTRDEVLRAPKEDYTRRLLASAPVPDPVEQRARRERG